MTGIERLRELSKGMHNHRMTVWQLTDDAYEERFGVTKHGPTIKNFLSDIADQIERESDVETVRSDAMEAWEWVREHGGLDRVKAEWSSRVPYDLYERRRQRLLGHIAECETALGRRNHRIEELGKTIEFFQLNNSNFRHLLADVAERLGFTRYGDDYEPEDLLDALDRRLMPDGCEWPRYESGEPVRIGGAIADELGHAHEVASVEVFDDAEALHWDPSEPEEFVWLVHGESAKRPAVLAADGKPLEGGQTVYLNRDSGNMEEGKRLLVTSVSSDVVEATTGTNISGQTHPFKPSELTHTNPEPPDSWERIEEDAKKDRCSYFGAKYQDCGRCTQLATSCSISKARDLVRRCRALAERERGE